MNEVIKLNIAELAIIRDHLGAIRSHKQQAQQYHTMLMRERRDLEVAFSNAMRRDMLDRGVNEPVHSFIGDDGMFNMNLAHDGLVTWVDGRKPKEE